jgi:hypothetical protein
MTAPAVDVYSTEVRYTLDIMGYLLSLRRPRTVRICADSPELVMAIVRRLALDGYELLVGDEGLRAEVEGALGVKVSVAGPAPADAAFCPSLGDHPSPAERVVVGATTNAMSYKTVRAPGSVKHTAVQVLRVVRQTHEVKHVVGLYPPRFVALLGAARAAGIRSSADYFRLSDRAMRHIFAFGPAWRVSYIVAMLAER